MKALRRIRKEGTEIAVRSIEFTAPIALINADFFAVTSLVHIPKRLPNAGDISIACSQQRNGVTRLSAEMSVVQALKGDAPQQVRSLVRPPFSAQLPLQLEVGIRGRVQLNRLAFESSRLMGSNNF